MHGACPDYRGDSVAKDLAMGANSRKARIAVHCGF
nr:MAG TPA: hypothetical protein [Caudoviricetes sp.]